MKEEAEEDGSAFAQLLGAFGSHADPEKRARSERLAVMKVSDRRRRAGPARTEQFNARISEAKLALAHKVVRDTPLNNGDIIELGIETAAKKYGVKADA